MPAAGLKVGVATVGKLIAYTAVAEELGLKLVLNALAFKVVVLDIEIADEYNAEDSVGSVPLVVYLILAPLVKQDIVTD
ncbi:MAG: hypothetical protein PHO32_01620 [Candidatus Cloacimonetes bacterium]|nr:hypothetical protein [Candidatus Cloacimonadota bacterium]